MSAGHEDLSSIRNQIAKTQSEVEPALKSLRDSDLASINSEHKVLTDRAAAAAALSGTGGSVTAAIQHAQGKLDTRKTGAANDEKSVTAALAAAEAAKVAAIEGLRTPESAQLKKDLAELFASKQALFGPEKEAGKKEGKEGEKEKEPKSYTVAGLADAAHSAKLDPEAVMHQVEDLEKKLGELKGKYDGLEPRVSQISVKLIDAADKIVAALQTQEAALASAGTHKEGLKTIPVADAVALADPFKEAAKFYSDLNSTAGGSPKNEQVRSVQERMDDRSKGRAGVTEALEQFSAAVKKLEDFSAKHTDHPEQVTIGQEIKDARALADKFKAEFEAIKREMKQAAEQVDISVGKIAEEAKKFAPEYAAISAAASRLGRSGPQTASDIDATISRITGLRPEIEKLQRIFASATKGGEAMLSSFAEFKEFFSEKYEATKRLFADLKKWFGDIPSQGGISPDHYFGGTDISKMSNKLDEARAAGADLYLRKVVGADAAMGRFVVTVQDRGSAAQMTLRLSADNEEQARAEFARIKNACQDRGNLWQTTTHNLFPVRELTQAGVEFLNFGHVVHAEGMYIIKKNLTGINVTGAAFDGVKMYDVGLMGMQANNTTWKNCELIKCHAQGATLARSVFIGSNANGIDLEHAILRDADLGNLSLKRSNLMNISAEGMHHAALDAAINSWFKTGIRGVPLLGLGGAFHGALWTEGCFGKGHVYEDLLKSKSRPPLEIGPTYKRLTSNMNSDTLLAMFVDSPFITTTSRAALGEAVNGARHQFEVRRPDGETALISIGDDDDLMRKRRISRVRYSSYGENGEALRRNKDMAHDLIHWYQQRSGRTAPAGVHQVTDGDDGEAI